MNTNKNLQKKVVETVAATAATVAGVAVTNNVHADAVNNNAQTQTVQDVRKQAIKNAEQGVKSAQANLDSATAANSTAQANLTSVPVHKVNLIALLALPNYNKVRLTKHNQMLTVQRLQTVPPKAT